MRTAAGELARAALGARPSGGGEYRSAASRARSSLSSTMPFAAGLPHTKTPTAAQRPSASRPKAPLASGGYIRRIPVTGAPRRLLGRSDRALDARNLRRLSMARSAALLPPTTDHHQCAVLPPSMGSVPGSRRSAVAGGPNFCLASGSLRPPVRLRGPRCFSTYTLSIVSMSIG